MNILLVVQRYGRDIIGGAELHCRLIAEHLAEVHNVEIATTCAADYLTWENVFPEGSGTENGLPVHRFPTIARRPADFDIIAHRVLFGHPSEAEEEEYLDAHGPVSPALIAFLESRCDIDRFILFSYRYWTTRHALTSVGQRSILVPTAEHDKTIHLKIHRESFLKPAAIAYNSEEERILINQVSANRHIPGITVGVGLVDQDSGGVPAIPLMDLPERFFLYVGRIEESKGCNRLLMDYMEFHRNTSDPPALVFLGKESIPLPDHPAIFRLGVQPEEVKKSVLRRALGLVMPSRYESLSMVLLEAWEQEKPVVVNAQCDVLLGQCVRSGGGLFYRNTEEFIEILTLLTDTPNLRKQIGRNGHRYYLENYTWPVIMDKYDRLLAMGGDLR